MEKNKVIKFQATSNGTKEGYIYLTIDKPNYKITEDTILEYEIFIDLSSPLSQAGIDFQMNSGLNLRNSGLVDQLYNTVHPCTSLIDASGKWFKRCIHLRKYKNKIVNSVEIAIVSPVQGVYTVYFKNIIFRKRLGRYEVIKQSKIINEPVIALSDDFINYDYELISDSELLNNIQNSYNTQFFQNFLKKKLKDETNILIEYSDKQRYYMAKEYKIKCIGHSHIDLNWLWNFDETEKIIIRDFETIIDLLERHKEFKFSQSQAFIYYIVLEKRPDLFDRIKKLVNKKQWEITASLWVESDLNLISGESIIRQILFAKTFILKHFSEDIQVAWLPDSFGHPASLPQIFNKSGIKYYYFMRGNKKSPAFFKWYGLDGSFVHVVNTLNYNGFIGQDMITKAVEFFQKNNQFDYLHVFGVGDHGGGPTIEDIRRGKIINSNPGLPGVIHSRIIDYFEEILKSNNNLKRLSGEFNPVFSGCYTTNHDIKAINRRLENSIYDFEYFFVLNLINGGYYPSRLINEISQKLAFIQFHDIICGTCISDVYKEIIPQLKGIMKTISNSIANIFLDSPDYIVNNIGKSSLNIYNQTSLFVSKPLKLKIDDFQNNYRFISNGKVLNSQVTKDGYILVDYNGIKPFSTKEIVTEKNRKKTLNKNNIKKNYSFENKYYSLFYDSETGCINKLIIKKKNKSKLAVDVELFDPIVVFHEKPHFMSAWTIGQYDKEILLKDAVKTLISESGIIRTVFEAEYKFTNIIINRKTILYKKLNYIEYEYKINWNEKGSEKNGSFFLKQLFSLKLKEDCKVFADIPHGIVMRKPDGQEMPMQNWLDVIDGTLGLSVINDSKYGYSVKKNKIFISLIRSSYEPDPSSGIGEYNFKIAVIPHFDDYSQYQNYTEGIIYNTELYCFSDVKNKYKKLSSGLINSIRGKVVVTSIKKCYNNDDLLIRLFEYTGEEQNILITFKKNLLFSVFEGDILEKKLSRIKMNRLNQISVKIKPYEIKTIIITMRIKRTINHSFKPI